jgi:putative ABC transport system permease protein
MLIKLAWRNIINRPFSSGLSVVMLASSLMIIVMGLLTMQQLKNKFNENANKVDLVVGAKGSRLQLVLCNIFHIDNPTGNVKVKDVNFLSKHPFVKSAIPISLGDSYKTYRIVGTEVNLIEDLYKSTIKSGRLFENSLEVVAGANAVEELNLKIGDTFYGSHGVKESTHKHEDFEYKIVGILNYSGEVIDNLLLTPLESVWDVHPNETQKGSFDLKNHKGHHHHDHHVHKEELIENKEVTAILVNYSSPRAKFSIPGIVNKKNQLMAAEPAIEIQLLFQLVEPAIKVISLLAWFIFGLSFFSVLITMLNSLKNRKYEIAMMRVGGASSKIVLSSILTEGILIAIIGSVLGLTVGHILTEFMGRYLSNSYHYQFTGFTFSPIEIWLFFGTILIGMISALLPAILAYKIDISSNLKNQI